MTKPGERKLSCHQANQERLHGKGKHRAPAGASIVEKFDRQLGAGHSRQGLTFIEHLLFAQNTLYTINEGGMIIFSKCKS